MARLFFILATLFNVYYLLCFFRIIFSWIPSINYSSIGKILSQICDPYLNLFRKLRMQFAGLDFSPAVALGILYIAQVVFRALQNGAKVTFGAILGMVIAMLWSVIQFILIVMFIVLIVRLIAELLQKNLYGMFWQKLDYFVSSTCRKITGRNFMDYKKQLLIAIAFFIALVWLGSAFVPKLAFMVQRLPF